MPLILNGTTGVSGIDGSAGTPSYVGGDSDTGLWYPAANTLALSTSGSERLRIDSSGNVGIGTSSPTARLGIPIPLFSASSTGGMIRFQNPDVAADSCIQSFYVTGAGSNIWIGSNNYIDTNGNTVRFSGSYASSAINLSRDGTLQFYTSTGTATERMRITTDGELCVGATSAYGSARFYVNAPQPTAANWWVSTLRTASTSAATTMIAFIDGSNDFCGQVYIEPTTNSTVFSTSSDYRLKDNVAPMTDALAKVQALNPVTYTWKKSGKTGQGFIAHELQEIVPECVVGEKDAMRTYTDEEGNEQTAILPQMVDTSFLVATLTAAIQEQQAMIEELKAKVAALEK